VVSGSVWVYCVASVLELGYCRVYGKVWVYLVLNLA